VFSLFRVFVIKIYIRFQERIIYNMAEESVIVTCPACGAKNRIPSSRLSEAPVCGKCRESLKSVIGTGKPQEVTDSTFERDVMKYPGAVLVDCWAPWCGPCKMVAPILDQLAVEYRGRAKIAKLNTDQNPEISTRYGIRSIPTMLIFKKGVQVDRMTGALPKQEIERHLASAL
jgi:thioredoxin 2